MSDLFDNPMINAAKKAMTKEQLEEYERVGKYMFDDMNFNTGEKLTESSIEDAGFYLSELLKAGLHPSMMEENEKNVMKDVYGDKWWEKFGYVEGDLTDMVTLEITRK